MIKMSQIHTHKKNECLTWRLSVTKTSFQLIFFFIILFIVNNFALYANQSKIFNLFFIGRFILDYIKFCLCSIVSQEVLYRKCHVQTVFNHVLFFFFFFGRFVSQEMANFVILCLFSLILLKKIKLPLKVNFSVLSHFAQTCGPKLIKNCIDYQKSHEHHVKINQ